MAQHQCSATLLLAKYSCPVLRAAVQKRLAATLFCCKNTYGDLLFPQVCNGPTPVQCHTAFGKIQLPPSQCCFAKQADSRLVLLQMQLWRFALDTGVQWLNTSAVPHYFWQNTVAPCSVLLCKKGWQQPCFAAKTPMEICSSHRCAVAQHQCSATLLLAKYSCPVLRAAVQKRLAATLFCCKNTYGDLLFPQVCSGPTPVQCHTAFGKIQLPPSQCCFAKQADIALCTTKRYRGTGHKACLCTPLCRLSMQMSKAVCR